MTTKRKTGTGRCLICRQMGHPLPKCTSDGTFYFDSKDSEKFEKKKMQSCWTRSCIDSVCTLIKISKTHPFRDFFLNANYCIDCLQLIRDVDFTLKQLKNFQSQILGFRKDLFFKLGDNYEAIPDNSELIDRSQKNQKQSKNEKRMFSFDEVVKMVYEKVSKDSESWTCTDFIDMDGGNPYKNTKFRNMLDICDEGESDEDGDFNECNTQEDLNLKVKSHFLGKRSKVNCNEIDEEKDEDSKNFSNPKKPVSKNQGLRSKNIKNYNETDTSDNKTAEKEITTENPSKPDKSDNELSDNCDDPDWNCSDDDWDTAAKSEKKQSKKTDSGDQLRLAKKPLLPKIKKIICNEEGCSKVFMKESTFLIHKRKIHEGDPKPYHCELCEVKYTSENGLQFHMLSHKVEQRCLCTICGKIYRSDRLLRCHMKMVHISKLKCKFCGLNFKKAKTDLLTHESLHITATDPFTCVLCSEVYSNSTDLRIHTENVHSDKPHLCGFCGKKFGELKGLRLHERIHDESFVKLICPDCGKIFVSRGNLNGHMRSHINERKFTCSVCKACFKEKKGLNIHMRRHNGDFRFECKVCGRKFTLSHNLKSHEQTHSTIFAYKCPLCDKSFKTYNSLKQHSKTHMPNRVTKKRYRKQKLVKDVTEKKNDLQEDVREEESGTSKEVTETIRRRNYATQKWRYKRKLHINIVNNTRPRRLLAAKKREKNPHYSTPSEEAEENVDEGDGDYNPQRDESSASSKRKIARYSSSKNEEQLAVSSIINEQSYQYATLPSQVHSTSQLIEDGYYDMPNLSYQCPIQNQSNQASAGSSGNVHFVINSSEALARHYRL